MADLDLDALLAPLQDDAPCGADLEYDPAFLALEAAGAGKPEQQYGDTVIPAEEPDWGAVHEQALALARRTRDLRHEVGLVRLPADGRVIPRFTLVGDARSGRHGSHRTRTPGKSRRLAPRDGHAFSLERTRAQARGLRRLSPLR